MYGCFWLYISYSVNSINFFSLLSGGGGGLLLLSAVNLIANGLDPDQDRQNVGPDLDLNHMTVS